MPVASRAPAKQELRYRAILDAGIECFDRFGFLGATTDQIADSSHVTKRTLYRYIGSKNQLLAAIHESVISEGLARWRAVVEQDGTPTEVLRRLIIAHVEIVDAHRRAVRVFFEEMRHLDSEAYQAVVIRRREYEAILTAIVRQGVESGEFDCPDITVSAQLILSMLNEEYRLYDADGRLYSDIGNVSPGELGDVIAEIILDGLAETKSSV